MSERPQRNLALDLVRVTESAALAGARQMGLGDKQVARAAVDAMRLMLQTVEMDGVIVIGEGEKSDARVLYNGESVGTGRPPAVDVAVDPVEGTSLLALGRSDVISVVALAERWSMWNPGPSLYADKLVVRRAARDAIDLRRSPTDNLRAIASALHCQPRDLTVFVLEKPRLEGLIREIREAGARVTLHTEGDVAFAILAATPGSGVDVLMGIGGAPEAVIAASAVRALGGGMQIRRAPQGDKERERVQAAVGPSIDEILTDADLIRSDDVFFAATGITDGRLVRGVRYGPEGVTTESIVMRGRSGTVRYIRAVHQLDRLMKFSQVDYGGNLNTAPLPERTSG